MVLRTTKITVLEMYILHRYDCHVKNLTMDDWWTTIQYKIGIGTCVVHIYLFWFPNHASY